MSDKFNPIFSDIKVDPATIFQPNLAATIDDTRTWVDPRGYRLSDRLWQARFSDRRAIDGILGDQIRAGKSPLQTARAVESYLHPDLQPRRDPTTYRVLPKSKQPPGVVTTTPRQGPGIGAARPRNSGLGSYAARRLARTETTRALGAATLRAAQANPFVRALAWRLSASHEDVDQCNDNATRSSRDMPRGVWLLDEVPRYPNHPQCMCTISPYVTEAEIDDAVKRLQRATKDGRFDEESLQREFSRRGRPPGSKNKPKDATPVAKAGDWRDEVRGIAANRTSDPDEIIRAGRLVKEDMYRSMDPERRAAWQRLNDPATEARRKAIADEYWDADKRRLRREAGTDREFDAEYDRISKAIRADRKLFEDKPIVEDVTRSLKKVRSIGSQQQHAHTPLKKDIDLNANYGNTNYAINQSWSDSPAIASLHRVRRDVPTEWWDASVNRTLGVDNPISSRIVPRGFYGTRRQSRQRGYAEDNALLKETNDKLMISGHDKASRDETAVHEFMHRAEDIGFGIVDAEKAYYQRRTLGEELQPMKGYAANEQSRPDKFNNVYMGKEYPDAYELLTMGATDLLKRNGVSYLFVGDEEMLDWTLGMLAVK